MTGTELMARIAALVPPPRYPLVRYHGCFAPAHIWRRSVVPKPPAPRAARAARRRPSESTEQTEPKPEIAVARPTPALAQADDLLEHSELRSPFVLSDPHLRRLLDGLLVMNRPRADWATLLRRSHHLDVLAARGPRSASLRAPGPRPRCQGRLRPLAVVRDQAQARRFLVHLARPHEPLSLAPARDPTFDFVA
jgi:hypothetical protein